MAPQLFRGKGTCDNTHPVVIYDYQESRGADHPETFLKGYSAILYSLVETAKANNLRVYEYLEYLLSELAEHADDTNRDFLKDLLPWSELVQEKCHSLKKS